MTQDDYSAFAEAAPTHSDLSVLSATALQLFEAERAVEEAERLLAQAKSRVQELSERILPDMMDDAGVSELKLRNGAQLKVEKVLQIGSVTKKPEVLEWLERTGHGSKIKREVDVALGKDPERQAKLMDTLNREGFSDVSVVYWVEPQTLKAHVKSIMENGGELDTEMLGVRMFNRAKITGKATEAGSAFGE